eukprot:3942035-Alexandrium_andersonii.AAC.1
MFNRFSEHAHFVSGVRSLSCAGPGTASTTPHEAPEGWTKGPAGAPEALSRNSLKSDIPWFEVA